MRVYTTRVPMAPDDCMLHQQASFQDQEWAAMPLFFLFPQEWRATKTESEKSVLPGIDLARSPMHLIQEPGVTKEA